MTNETAKRGPGRPPFIPTKEHRSVVQALVAGGVNQKWIARYIGVDEDTLVRHFRHDLDGGHGIMEARLVGMAYRKALAGDKTMLIFLLKTRHGFSDVHGHQFLGKNGQPIDFDNLSDSALDQVIAAIKATLGVAEGGEPEGDAEFGSVH